jgi:hypothetical protein
LLHLRTKSRLFKLSFFCCCLETLGEWSLHYGYLDAKPYFYGTPAEGELHLVIRINPDSGGRFWLCSAGKDDLQHVHVSLEANVDSRYPGAVAAGTASGGAGPPADGENQAWKEFKEKYAPGESRTALSEFAATAGGVCKEFSNIPEGVHVVSIAPDPAQPAQVSSITHVVTWA